MAIFFAPEVEYKAPTFQELVAPLAMYKQYYDQQEKEFNAQREKAAALRAMLGTDPNNEISAYMKDYNDLLDQTSQQYASGDMPYAKLYDNVRQLQDIWLDKGLKMTNAIEANTKYREARAKHPNWIGPDLKLQDFLADPQRFYSFFDPDEAAKAGATAGAIYAQQNPHGQAEKDRDGVLRYWVGPTPAQLQDVFTNPQNPFYAEAQHAMSNNGIDPNDAAQVAAFQKQYIQGLASTGKYEYAKDPDYKDELTRQNILSQIANREAANAQKDAINEAKNSWAIRAGLYINGKENPYGIQNGLGQILIVVKKKPNKQDPQKVDKYRISNEDLYAIDGMSFGQAQQYLKNKGYEVSMTTTSETQNGPNKSASKTSLFDPTALGSASGTSGTTVSSATISTSGGKKIDDISLTELDS